MGKDTSVGYADASFNFVRGCRHVSAGCDNCTGEATAAKANDVLGTWGPEAAGGRRVVTGESDWNNPLRWNEDAKRNCVPMRVLAMTLGDVFEPWEGPLVDTKGHQLFRTPAGGWITKQSGTPGDAGNWDPLHKDHALERWLSVVGRTPNLQWLVLTKFPEYVIPALSRVARLGRSDDSMKGSVIAARWVQGFYPNNLWLGVSAEDQERLSQRVFYLRNVEARVKFVVVEPMLTAMTIRHWFDRSRFESDSFNWLVIGGEVGVNARKFDTQWAVDLVGEAMTYGVPVWVQSVGSNPFAQGPGTSRIKLATSDERGEVPAEWPEEMRLRELPELEGF